MLLLILCSLFLYLLFEFSKGIKVSLMILFVLVVRYGYWPMVAWLIYTVEIKGGK